MGEDRSSLFIPDGGMSRKLKDFELLGLKPGNVPEEWEDGQRIGNYNEKNFEWWYTDAKMEDGSALVINFHAKGVTGSDDKLNPRINLEWDRPDGSTYHSYTHFNPSMWSSSTDTCNVTVGKNFIRGDLKKYTIHVEDERMTVDVTIVSEAEPWRNDTGHLFFSEDRSRYFAWVVPVPKGRMQAAITLDGKTETFTGSCYHDHNWGTIDMMQRVNHWYWARAEIGPYNVICADLICEKQHDFAEVNCFYISKDGKTVADDWSKVESYRSVGKIQTGKGLNKPMSDKLKYIYGTLADEDLSYVLTLHKHCNITEKDILGVNIRSKWLAWILKRVLGKSPAYYRMLGAVTLEVHNKNVMVESYNSENAVWELMHLGNAIGSN